MVHRKEKRGPSIHFPITTKENPPFAALSENSHIGGEGGCLSSLFFSQWNGNLSPGFVGLTSSQSLLRDPKPPALISLHWDTFSKKEKRITRFWGPLCNPRNHQRNPFAALRGFYPGGGWIQSSPKEGGLYSFPVHHQENPLFAQGLRDDSHIGGEGGRLLHHQ